MNVNRKSEIFLTSIPGHRNVTFAQLPAGVSDAVEIRALGIIAPVIYDVAQAVADRFAAISATLSLSRPAANTGLLSLNRP